MNTLILNRETFELPADGWYQIAPIGEFPHAGAGVIQVVDAAACEAMANAFRAEAEKPNFAGLLIDFDHFSLDGKQKSEAAGWIVALEYRGPRDEGVNLKPEMGTYNNADGVEPVPPVSGNLGNAGLWGKIRWSDAGEACVRGGRYRFLSPVWAKADCEDLGDGRLRPVRLMNAAVTNDPNIKGMVPLSNRRSEDRGQMSEDQDGLATEGTKDTKEEIANGSPAPRFKWVLGVHDRHCPSCSALAGQVHAMADWEAAGLRPGAAGLFCQGNCHCELVETDEGESGSLAAVAVRKDVMNRVQQGELRNKWSDAARAAALAVRRAKAAERKRQREQERKEAEGKGKGIHDGGIRVLPIDDVEVPGKGKPGDGKDDDKYYPLPVEDEYEYWRHAMEGYRQDAEQIFRETYGHLPESPDEIREAEEMAGIPPEYRTGGKVSSEDLAKKLFKKQRGLDDGMKIQPVLPRNPGDSDPGHEQLERESARKAREERQRGIDETEAVHGRAEDLMEREGSGESLTAEEKKFLKRYREILGDLSGLMGNREKTADHRLQTVDLGAYNAANKLASGAFALSGLTNLYRLDTPGLTRLGEGAISGCTALETLHFPNTLTYLEGQSLYDLPNLQAVYWGGDLPLGGNNPFGGSTTQAVNYVTNPTATGWGAMLGTRPVVRLEATVGALTLGGVRRVEWPGHYWPSQTATYKAYKFPAGDYLFGDGTNLFYVTAAGVTNKITANP